MVSSDFGKFDVIRHLISGDDCAMAGEATAVAAAPAAETFKKSRRFIQSLLETGRFPYLLERSSGGRIPCHPGRSGRGALTRKSAVRIRDNGMTALIKRKSHTACRGAISGPISRPQAAAMAPLSWSRTWTPMAR